MKADRVVVFDAHFKAVGGRDVVRSDDLLKAAAQDWGIEAVCLDMQKPLTLHDMNILIFF